MITTSEKNTRPNPRQGFSIHRRLPLTWKMTLLTLVLGTTIWALLDHFQNENLKSTFETQLLERLSRQSREDRLRFDRYVKSFHLGARLILSQEGFREYITTRNWMGGRFEVIHHRRKPAWLPARSILRIFPQARFVLLLDGDRQVREIYQPRPETPPRFLLEPSEIMLRRSHGQSMMTTIDNTPFFLTSQSLAGPDGQPRATLLLGSPIDDEFLIQVFTPSESTSIRALLTKDRQHILISTDQQNLTPGMRLADLEGRYLMTGKEFFDYGSSDLEITLASFIPLDEVNALTREIITRARQQRTLFAVILIASSILIMYWVTRDIKILTRQVINFERQELGVEDFEAGKGDELLVLRNRFQRLLAELVTYRELIEREAREKTRTIVNNAIDAIISIDTDGAITTWNPSAAIIFGISAEEAVGKNIFETITSTDHREIFRKNLPDFIESETKKEPILKKRFEIIARHRHGHEFPVDISAALGESENDPIIILFIQDISKRKKAEDERKKMITELQAALAEIKTLRGIFSICASCKKIRDDQGYWNQIEDYIRARSEAEFTHSICPDCARKLYPEFDIYDSGKKK